ncbi:PAS domain S-box protein [Anaerolineae bacterium CFX9]|nr:PAS domain S-box protein [Anaerolineae bacterium CFX9]
MTTPFAPIMARPPLVLLAGGETEMVKAVTDILVDDGYQVVRALNAASTYTLHEQHEPDLAIIDSRLEGEDPIDVCRKLAAQAGIVPPTMFLLEQTDPFVGDRTIEKALQVGVIDVIQRPLMINLVRRRIEQLIYTHRTAMNLYKADRRWTQVFEDNLAIKLIVDIDHGGAIVHANQAACEYYGYPLEDLRRLSLSDLDATRESSTKPLQTLFSFRHRTANGEIRDVKLYMGPIDYQDRELTLCIIQDVTKRREAESAEREQRTLVEALRATSATLLTTLDLDELLDQILDYANRIIPNDCTNIMLIDDEGYASVVRFRGYEGRDAEAMMNERLKVSETANLRQMIETGGALVIPDTDAYPGWLRVPVAAWIRSHVGAPIRIDNEVIGFLTLDSEKPNHYDADDAEKLHALADQAALAVRNARLYRQVVEYSAQLEERVQERTNELITERGQLRAILDAMTEGVAYAGMVPGESQVKIFYVNPAMTHITGYSFEEWQENGIALLQSVGLDEAGYLRARDTVYNMLIEHGIHRAEARLVRKDRSEYDAATVTSRITDTEGNIIGAVIVLRDISQEKALQGQKSRFFAHASHELRTPITNLKTRLYLLRKQPEKLADHLPVMEDVTERMKKLVDDLLDISRFERGTIHINRHVTDLCDVVRDTVLIQEPEAERKGLKLTLKLPRTPVRVYIDPDRIGQAVTNLLTNAINYTPSGGAVSVRVTTAKGERGAVHYSLVEVEDTGIGISREHMQHIFQPFYRVVSQVRGTGLGLSITQEIIELHEGRIGVESEPGKGSCFSFWLPLVTDTVDQGSLAATKG